MLIETRELAHQTGTMGDETLADENHVGSKQAAWLDDRRTGAKGQQRWRQWPAVAQVVLDAKGRDGRCPLGVSWPRSRLVSIC